MAAGAAVPMRTFDGALRQYSNDHQKPDGANIQRTVANGTKALTGQRARDPQRTGLSGQFRTDVYFRLLEAAIAGRTIAYGELPGGRGHIGGYLYRIAEYEKAHCRPPLTPIVVRKQTRRPGEGFLVAMDKVAYARPGETEAQLWDRAVADVFAYWQP